jgi:hypothetical protein
VKQEEKEKFVLCAKLLELSGCGRLQFKRELGKVDSQNKLLIRGCSKEYGAGDRELKLLEILLHSPCSLFPLVSSSESGL